MSRINGVSFNFDTFFKTLTFLLAGIGFLFGVYQFVIQQQREYRQKIYESQLELYKDVMDVSSKIANSPYDSVGTENFKNYSNKYDVYYYGKMTLFENREVEREMIKFKFVKDKYLHGVPAITTDSLKKTCLYLGYACRNSLQETWGLKLEVLERNKQL